jgi:hypothetical protein
MLDAERESFPLSRIRSIRRFKLKWQPDHVSIKCNGPIHVSDKFNDVLSLVDIHAQPSVLAGARFYRSPAPIGPLFRPSKTASIGDVEYLEQYLVPHCRQ